MPLASAVSPISEFAMYHNKVSNLPRLFCLLSAVCCSGPLGAATLAENVFWKTSVGYWASDNTYIDGRFNPKIPHYQTLNSITIEGNTVISEERKFYPAGAFAADALGLTVPADKGVQLIQVSRGLANTSADRVDYAPINEYSRYQQTWEETLSADTAVRTVASEETGAVSYKVLITLPTSDSRITASLGVNSDYVTDSTQLPLRGVSVFSASRITAEQFHEQTRQLQLRYDIGAVVTINEQGKYQATLIEK